MKVKEIMSKGVVKINSNASVLEAAQLMSEREIGSLVVEGEDEVGILTERDLLKRVIAKGRDSKNLKVKDVMTPSCCTIEAEAQIEEANKIMHNKNIRRLPVTKKGEMIGMITIRDVAKSLVYSRVKSKRRYGRERKGSSWS